MLNTDVTPEILNQGSKNHMVGHVGIEITEVGKDYLCGKMPVDKRTHQPMGLLHGGASVVLAETLGSIGATLAVDTTKYFCVGLEINANHIRGVREGYVYGKATPLHIGRSTHVWQINITNEEGKLVCTSRITMAVREIKKPASK
ncbi:thioesterase [marine bacterium AO1-C]|nr:thioesterase [marine bacterium AO1-C]